MQIIVTSIYISNVPKHSWQENYYFNFLISDISTDHVILSSIFKQFFAQLTN